MTVMVIIMDEIDDDAKASPVGWSAPPGRPAASQPRTRVALAQGAPATDAAVAPAMVARQLGKC